MKIRDNGICDFCGKDLTGLPYEETATRLKHSFCNYACMEGFYTDEIPEDEDFLIVPR